MDNLSTWEKIKRYTQLSKNSGDIFLRFIGNKYLGDSLNKKKHAFFLKESLGEFRGPLVKIAQFLATIPDTLPPEYAEEFLTLQSQAPKMGKSFVVRRMKGELGADWGKKFLRFDFSPKAAASLGQVHQAYHLDGTPLACKLQYPGMEVATQIDLSYIKIFVSLYKNYSNAIHPDDLVEEIKDRLEEELDYHHEKKQIEIFQNIFKNEDFVKIPEVFESLSTKKLLTMSWMSGKSLLEFTDSCEDFRNLLAKNLFLSWYKPLLHHGVLHGDPHPGNYFGSQEGIISLLDFGCTRNFSKNFVKGVVSLYEAIRDNDEEKTVYSYEIWGFKSPTKEVISIMNQWAKLLYEPLLDDNIRPIQKNFTSKDGLLVAEKIHKSLEKLGGITPPKEFVFMDRAAVGLAGVIMKIKAKQNWHQLFENLMKESELLNN